MLLRENMAEKALKMRGITKTFPGVVANDNVDLEVEEGEIHAILGENGAGKSTLMKVLYGLYKEDSGEIFIDGERVEINSPSDAMKHRIGMIHQHFQLTPPNTVLENVILGDEPTTRGKVINKKKAEEKVKDIMERHRIDLDLEAPVYSLSVGEKQLVEILKLLYREMRFLIMDEPTAALPPEGVERLLDFLKRIREEKIIIFISHKLPEVLEISDRIMVMRDGKVQGVFDRDEVTTDELIEAMVGKTSLLTGEDKEEFQGEREEILEVENLKAKNDRGTLALNGVSFSVRNGEILGVAGVSGNGQKELVEVLTGLRKAEEGSVIHKGEEITNLPPSKILSRGVSHIPEDRTETGANLDFSIAENLILDKQADPGFREKFCTDLGLPMGNVFCNFDYWREHADELIDEFGIVVPNQEVKAGKLSGGNLQRLILARELSRDADLIIANNPTRGLDVKSQNFVQEQLIDRRSKGGGVLLVSHDLDELLKVSDRIITMYEGRIMGETDAKGENRQKIGSWMSGRE